MDVFQTLAECSIAFAGFGAIHAALERSAAPRVLHRAFTIVLTGSVSFVLSVFVLALDALSVQGTALWQWASAFGFLLAGTGLAFFWWSHKRISRLGFGPQSPVFFGIASTILLGALPLLLLNATRWFWSPGAGVYALALTLILFAGLFALLGSFWFPLASSAKPQGSDAAGRDQP